jgi:carbamoyl-phosphate synthase large subunit
MAITAIKALKQDEDIIVISADVDHLAPGLYLSHKGFLLPPFKGEDFFDKLKELVKREKVDVVIPALDTILLRFSQEAESFEELGTHVMVSEPETIRVTRDKWETYLHLKDMVPLPKSFVKKGHVDIDYPLFIKPREGSGSKQTYVINSPKELEFFCSYVRKPIIQEFLSGKEYTVDCLADMEGNLVACVPRERIETRDGISTKGLIVESMQLTEIGKVVSKKLKFKGPFFFQAKEDRYGNPKLTEINARIAGTMCPMSFLEGNFHSLAVRLCMGEKVRIPKIRYGTYVSRYWEELYLDESEIQAKISRAYLNGPKS